MQCTVNALNPACDVQAHTLKVSTMSNDLKNHVQSIADNLTNPPMDEWNEGRDIDSEGEFSAFDYLQDALDIEYIVNSRGEYLGARVLVAFGGPNIWVNTRTGTVEGAWWADRAQASFKDNLGLDEALSELWASGSVCR
jgi:hypothetical protein